MRKSKKFQTYKLNGHMKGSKVKIQIFLNKIQMNKKAKNSMKASKLFWN